MRFLDLSTDTQKVYRLNAHEEAVFFLFNRSGEITIELAGPGATAHIFAAYRGGKSERHELRLIQRHLAPDTTSSALVKSALTDRSTLTYAGTVIIDAAAHRSDAAQESRALLLGLNARAESRPALEVLAHDVRCHHAATTSPLNEAAIFFAMSRGLTRDAATQLLVQGFFRDLFDHIESFGIDTDALRKKYSAIS